MLELIKRHIVLIVIAIAVFAGLFLLNKDEKPFEAETEMDFEQQIELVEKEVESEVATSIIVVDIKGEVKQPGVYEVDQHARVTDVISTAGGLTEHADQTQINLAQKVQDEMVINIPKEGEEATTTFPVGTITSDNDTNKIHINSATKEEIETLNGIGPKKAQAIIDHREENGPFQTIDDLTDVSGIGEKTLENIKDNIIVP